MTAREVLDGITRRESRRQAMIEDGSYKVNQTRCNDPERCGVHMRHPENVRVETSHHHSYISHLEALADHTARLTRAVEDILGLHRPITHHFLTPPAGSVEVCHSCREEYPCPTVAAIEDALNPKEGQ